MNNVVVYPIIIKFVPDNTNYPYLVEIPAINGFTQGRSISDSIKMAEDYIETFSLTNSKMPQSSYELPTHKKNEIVTLIKADLTKYKKEKLIKS